MKYVINFLFIVLSFNYFIAQTSSDKLKKEQQKLDE